MRVFAAILQPLRAKPWMRAHPARDGGFSLVEVLVALSITALASALIVATARPADRLKTEGETLTHVIEQMQTRARISGTPIGLALDPRGYEITVWRDGAWSGAGQKRHALAPGVTIRWAQPLIQRNTDASASMPDPDVIIDPLGHSNFQPIVLESKGRELAVSGDFEATGPTP